MKEFSYNSKVHPNRLRSPFVPRNRRRPRAYKWAQYWVEMALSAPRNATQKRHFQKSVNRHRNRDG